MPPCNKSPDWDSLTDLERFMLNAIDRNAVPQARQQGLERDLNLVGSQYNTVLSLTFAGYILGQVPSNMIMSNLDRPSRYLSAMMVAWGLLSAVSGAVRHFEDIAICRLLLGLCEAPFLSGVAFLFSGWYTRKEIGKRLGVFFCGSMTAGAIGGLLAAGIAAAFHGSSMPSWRWMFVIEGAATVIVALLALFLVPDWPSTTRWLSEEEKALALLRLREDCGAAEEEQVTTRQALRLAIVDYKVWLCVFGQTAMQAVASVTNFLPILVDQFGQGTVATLLLTAPPYAVTAFYSVIACFCSDWLSKRSIFIVWPSVVAMAGITVILATTDVGARYAALFLVLPGTCGCFQISNAWMANIASRPRKKRGIALALNNGLGNSALLWTPYLYASDMGPKFTLAWSVNMGLLAALLVSTVVLSLTLQAANKKMDNGDAGAPHMAHDAAELDGEAGLSSTRSAPARASGEAQAVSKRVRFDT